MRGTPRDIGAGAAQISNGTRSVIVSLAVVVSFMFPDSNQEMIKNVEAHHRRQHGIDTLETGVIYPGTEVMPMSANGSKSAKVRANLDGVKKEDLKRNVHIFPSLKRIRMSHPRKAAIVDRYFIDMRRAMMTIANHMQRHGTFVLVCGDNLVGGYSIPTWRILGRILEGLGFRVSERFGDRIECRYVPPQRHGHKGLIKREIVSVFHRGR